MFLVLGRHIFKLSSNLFGGFIYRPNNFYEQIVKEVQKNSQ